VKKPLAIFLVFALCTLLFGAFENCQTTDGLDPCSDSAYSDFKSRVHYQRKYFLVSYNKVSNKKLVVDSCKKYLENCLKDSMNTYWENTHWDFYGTTQKPRCGNIACGYFVTTVLRDLDFNIPRIEWAKVAAEIFIRKFCNSNVVVYSAKSESFVETELRKKTWKYLYCWAR